MISALFPITGIHSTRNLKTTEPAENVFNLANTKFLFEEPLEEKRHRFTGMCFLFKWFKFQILKLCQR